MLLQAADQPSRAPGLIDIAGIRASGRSRQFGVPGERAATAVDYCCGRLAGGTMPFIRRYSTIWP